MANLINTISWFTNGEKANELVLNRPLKEIVNLIDSNTLPILPKYSGINLLTGSFLASPNDLVYKRSDGILVSAVGNSTITDKVIGIYQIINNIDVLIFNGEISGLTGLIPGDAYYLDNTIPGAFTNVYYSNAVKIGTALSSTSLLLSTGGSGNASFPSQTNNNGKFLSTDGTSVSWQDPMISSNSIEITATAGQTIFNVPGGYTTGFIEVYRAGILLQSTDYTENGTDVTLLVPAALNDIITIKYFGTTNIVNTYTKAETDTLIANVNPIIASNSLEITATAGQTIFNVPGGYTTGYIEVYSSGILLQSTEYTENGTDVTLLVPAALNDIITIRYFGTTNIADIYTKLETDTLLQNQTHVEADITDLDKYTKAQTDSLLAAVVPFNYITKTAAYTALEKDYIFCDTSIAGFTITLPLSPIAGSTIGFMDSKGTFTTNNLIIGRNTNTIMGLAQDLTISTDNANIELIYTGTDWRIK